MRGRQGFTFVEILLVVAIIGILIGIAQLAYLRAREVARARVCQMNLYKIDGAKEQYAIGDFPPSSLVPRWTDLVGETLYLRRTPRCPSGGAYSMNNIDTDPTCDYAKPLWLEKRFNHAI